MDNTNSEREQDEGASEDGKDDRYILVVGFTKETAYQFVRIRQHRDGSIYVGFAYRGEAQPHFSYHASGETHTAYVDQNGKVVKADKKQATPLADFHGEYSLGTWVVISPSFPLWKELTVEKERKIQALLCFGMSHLTGGQTGQLSINCTLLESGRVDLLPKMVSEIPSDLNPQVLVITATNPWIVIRAIPV